MTIELIIGILGLIGVGGIIQAFVTYLISTRKKKTDSKQDLKERRYKATLLLCFAFINFEREHSKIVINRPNIESQEELLSELYAEWVNMSLYASDSVILRMKDLLENQSQNEFNSLIIEMRKDLYSVKPKLKSNSFRLSNEELNNLL